MSEYIKQNSSIMNFNTSSSWVVLSAIESSIKQKIENVGVPLKDWDIQINYGIKTGLNDAFIINEEKRNQILSNCTSEEERVRTDQIIRPVLRGRDIEKYSYNWAGLYLISTFPSRHYNIDDYPALKDYLLTFDKRVLAQSGEKDIDGIKGKNARKKTCNKWFETQDSIGYWDEFNKQKIVFQEIVQSSQFAFDSEGIFYCNDTCRIITGKNLYHLLGVLNSNLFFFVIKKFYGGGGLGENGVRMKHTFFEQFHCIETNNEIEKIVNNIITSDSPVNIENWVHEIDYIIYNAYHLSDEEVNYIEKMS